MSTVTKDFEISDDTKKILQNFAAINQSLQFRPGNELKTISQSKDIFAVADVRENFPSEFAIYDVSRLLGVLGLFEGAKITFKDKFLTIKGDKKELNYVYAEPSMIVAAPDKDFVPPPVYAEFDLSKDALKEIGKVVGLLSLQEVVFVSNGKAVAVKAVDVKNPTGDNYLSKVGATDKSFQVVFKQEKITKLLDNDYHVTITHDPQGASIIIFEGPGVKYYIAPEESSVYE